MKAQYGVFHGTKWGITTNKKTAITFAKNAPVFAEVRRKRFDYSAYDAPTFYVLSDRIYANDKEGGFD